MGTVRITAAATMLLCGGATNTDARTSAIEPMTTIVGVVRNVNSGSPLKNAAVRTNDSTVVAYTDSAGRFILETSRKSTLLAVSKDKYLEFRFPLLELTTDTLVANIELRTDPPTLLVVGSRPGYVPTLCIVQESPKELAVTNTCELTLNAPPGYTQKGYKHHPGKAGVYFGPAGDDGGILVRKRLQPSQ